MLITGNTVTEKWDMNSRILILESVCLTLKQPQVKNEGQAKFADLTIIHDGTMIPTISSHKVNSPETDALMNFQAEKKKKKVYLGSTSVKVRGREGIWAEEVKF